MSIKKNSVEGAGLLNWSIPISHAVVVNNWCLTSRKSAVNSKGNYEEATIHRETDLAFSIFFAALMNGGIDDEDVISVDVALDDLKNLSEVNAIFMELFPEDKRPARTICQAEELTFGGKIKIIGTAVKDIIT